MKIQTNWKVDVILTAHGQYHTVKRQKTPIILFRYANLYSINDIHLNRLLYGIIDVCATFIFRSKIIKEKVNCLCLPCTSRKKKTGHFEKQMKIWEHAISILISYNSSEILFIYFFSCNNTFSLSSRIQRTNNKKCVCVPFS